MKFKILGIFIAAVIIESVIFLFSLQKNNNVNTSISSPKPISSPQENPINTGIDSSYNASFKKLIPEIKEADKKANAVGALLDLLPYTESFFSLSYDIDKNQFTATIAAADKEAGLSELDVFLKNNGVGDKSWLNNLNIVYK